MKMQHVTIRVADMERSIAFYTDVIGLKIQRDRRPQAPIVFLAETPDEVPAELIEEPDNSYAGHGVDIGFHCNDVRKAYGEMEAAGYELSSLRNPRPGVYFFYVKDPDGVSVQFIGE